MALPVAPITESYAREQLALWLAALEAAAKGSSYSIADRSLTRQNLAEIRGEIQRWHNTVAALSQRAAGRRRSMVAQASFPTPGAGTGTQHHPWSDGTN